VSWKVRSISFTRVLYHPLCGIRFSVPRDYFALLVMFCVWTWDNAQRILISVACSCAVDLESVEQFHLLFQSAGHRWN
ncbi:hypothetical protein A2U01_0064458, partial [Trifolium medium]|nr:hypothetical protein [Trifolium medium]